MAKFAYSFQCNYSQLSTNWQWTHAKTFQGERALLLFIRSGSTIFYWIIDKTEVSLVSGTFFKTMLSTFYDKWEWSSNSELLWKTIFLCAPFQFQGTSTDHVDIYAVAFIHFFVSKLAFCLEKKPFGHADFSKYSDLYYAPNWLVERECTLKEKIRI